MAPFLTKSMFLLIDWYYSATNFLSLSHLTRLITIFQNKDFTLDDFQNVNIKSELERLDKELPGRSEAQADPASEAHGWYTSSIEIPLPCERVKRMEENAAKLQVDGLVHRQLIELVKMTSSDPSAVFQYILFPRVLQAHAKTGRAKRKAHQTLL